MIYGYKIAAKVTERRKFVHDFKLDVNEECISLQKEEK